MKEDKINLVQLKKVDFFIRNNIKISSADIFVFFDEANFGAGEQKKKTYAKLIIYDCDF